MLLVIDYGFDIHKIKVDPAIYDEFESGQVFEIVGQGFVDEEGRQIDDHWAFNRTPGEIYVWLENGREFFAHDYWLEDDARSAPTSMERGC